MSTSRADASTTAAANSSRQIAWSRRTVCALLATGACVAAFPAATQASSGSPAAAYCSHLPASKVASIVGGQAIFKSAVVVKTTLECEYAAGVAIVALLKEPGLPASSLATLSKAEATALSGFPKGTKVKFSALPALGKTSFGWTATIAGVATRRYHAVIDFSRYASTFPPAQRAAALQNARQFELPRTEPV